MLGMRETGPVLREAQPIVVQVGIAPPAFTSQSVADSRRAGRRGRSTSHAPWAAQSNSARPVCH